MVFNGECLWKPLILCIAMVAKDGRKGQIGNCTCNCLVQQENVYPWFHINVRFISVNSNSIFSKQVIIPQISHSPFSSFQQYFFSQLLVFAGVDSCDFCLNIILQCLSKSVHKTRRCLSWPFPALSFLPGVVDNFWLFLSCRQFLLIQICWQFQHQIYLLTVPNLLFRFALLCLFNCILLPLFKVGQVGNNLSTHLNALFGSSSKPRPRIQAHSEKSDLSFFQNFLEYL